MDTTVRTESTASLATFPAPSNILNSMQCQQLALVEAITTASAGSILEPFSLEPGHDFELDGAADSHKGNEDQHGGRQPARLCNFVMTQVTG
jgi:hypothetical protein